MATSTAAATRMSIILALALGISAIPARSHAGEALPPPEDDSLRARCQFQAAASISMGRFCFPTGSVRVDTARAGSEVLILELPSEGGIAPKARFFRIGNASGLSNSDFVLSTRIGLKALQDLRTSPVRENGLRGPIRHPSGAEYFLYERKGLEAILHFDPRWRTTSASASALVDGTFALSLLSPSVQSVGGLRAKTDQFFDLLMRFSTSAE